MKFWSKSVTGPNVHAFMFKVGKVYLYVNLSTEDIHVISKSRLKEILKADALSDHDRAKSYLMNIKVREWKRQTIVISKDESIPQYLIAQLFEYQTY